MRSASLYRVSGNSLIVAALLWALSLLLLPKGPTNTIAEAMARVGPAWIISGVLMTLGCIAGMVGMVGLYRHFTGSDREGWVLLGAAAGVSGALLAMASMAIAAVGLPIALRMVQDATLATPEPAEAALLLAVSSLYILGGTLMWLGLLPFGYGMLGDRLWSRPIAWGAIVIGVVEAIGGFVLMTSDLPLVLLMIVGFAFLAVLGNALARSPRALGKVAPVEQPGTPV